MAETRVPIRYGSWQKFCERLEIYDQDSGDTVLFYAPVDPPDIEPQDRDSEYIVKENDRLDKIAQQFYGVSGAWWVIALRNDMDWPFIEMTPGERIIIPDSDYVRTILE